MTAPDPFPDDDPETATEAEARKTVELRRRRQERHTTLIRLARVEREARAAQERLLGHPRPQDNQVNPVPWVPPEMWDMARTPFEHEDWDGPDWRILDIATWVTVALAAIGLASIVLAIARRF